MTSPASRTPTVSVVLAVRNAVRYLHSAESMLKSLDRTACDYQVIVVDDGSDDETWEMLATWASTLAGVTLLRGSGRGVAEARNIGVEHVKGDFVWFTDVDDTFEPKVVREMLAGFTSDDVDLVCSNARKVSEDGRELGMIADSRHTSGVTGTEGLRLLLSGHLQGHLWNKLFRRSAARTIAFPRMGAHSDLAWLIQLLPGVQRIGSVEHTGYSYVQRPGSIINGTDYRWRDLLVCLQEAEQAVRLRRGDCPLGTALRTFRYRTVVVPAANQIIRTGAARLPSAVEGDLEELRAYIRSRDLLHVLLRAPRASLQAAVIKVAPRVYAKVYGAYGRSAWVPRPT